MKKFIYCQITDGGMEDLEFEFKDCIIDFTGIYYWMDNSCVESDKSLLKWANNAKPGDYLHHRMGICFMVN